MGCRPINFDVLGKSLPGLQNCICTCQSQFNTIKFKNLAACFPCPCKYSFFFLLTMFPESQSLSGSSPLCVITISNIKRYRVGESKHNTVVF